MELRPRYRAGTRATPNTRTLEASIDHISVSSLGTKLQRHRSALGASHGGDFAGARIRPQGHFLVQRLQTVIFPLVPSIRVKSVQTVSQASMKT